MTLLKTDGCILASIVVTLSLADLSSSNVWTRIYCV